VLLYFTENALKESELCIGGNFVSSLTCTLKSKKPKKTKQESLANAKVARDSLARQKRILT